MKLPPLFEAVVVAAAEADAEDDDGLLWDDCKKGAFIVIESANTHGGSRPLLRSLVTT